MPEKAEKRWGQRIGWLFLIWLGSVLALGAVSLLLRLIMRAVGLSL
ncbi:MAG TPA: DUF2474 domain-containing protein [Methylovorus sp.]|jgi:hypothetical protein|nr:DUF2474 domain-containing protein [Methylovorus sp.]